MYALLGRFVGIEECFPTNTKFCDLDLGFALQWTHTDIDFSLFSFTPLITSMIYAWLCRFAGIDEFFPTNTKFYDLDLDFALQWTHTEIDFSLFFFLLKPVFLTLTVNISSFKVTYIFSALIFLVNFAALQSGHTAFSGFLFNFIMLHIPATSITTCVLKKLTYV